MEWVEAGSLKANPANWRKHPAHQVAALRESIADVGWAGALLYNERTHRLIDGHARRDNAEPTELVPVLVGHWTDQQERRILATLDPITALAEPDPEALGKLLEGLTFDGEALAKLGQDLAREIVLPAITPDLSEMTDPPVPEKPKRAITRRGDVWTLGDSRLVCGDCTTATAWGKLMIGQDQLKTVLLTDPPYCSGGFQEAGRAAGSVGRRGDARVANDTLSTRGYTSLIKTMLGHCPAGLVYLFTDWRQWVNLFDTVEASGFGVRAMVVWDKGTPGMGRGWRSQHELIMCGSRVAMPFDPKRAQGNVLDCKRVQHVHHATEKPVQLMAAILAVTDILPVALDPFAGSGTVLLAAHQLDRPCLSIELDPKYCDVIIERWQNLTGGKAKRVKR